MKYYCPHGVPIAERMDVSTWALAQCGECLHELGPIMNVEMPVADLAIWHRSGWEGRVITHDDGDLVSISHEIDFGPEDVLELLGSAETGTWDGVQAAVFVLKDGRYISYESFWGPTGSGFVCDAYGGTADVHVVWDIATIVRWGLTDEGRRLLGIEQPGFEVNRDQ